MATNTTNFNLSKPAYSDTADIAVINGNMDKVDTALQGLGSGLAIVSKNNTHAAITTGQYVYVHGHGSLAEGLYTAKSNISANATLSTSNLQAVSNGGLNLLNNNKVEYIDDIASNMNSAPFVQRLYVGKWEGTTTSNAPLTSTGGAYIAYATSVNYQTQIGMDNYGNAFIRGEINGTWGNWGKVISDNCFQAGSKTTNSSGVATVTFSKSLPSTPIVVCTPSGQSASNMIGTKISNLSSTGFTITATVDNGSSIAPAADNTIRWIAVVI